MKTIVNEVLGFEIELRNIPETMSEAVSQAGSEAVVLNNHIRQVIAHSHNGEVRDKIVAYLEKATGVNRKTQTVGEGEKAKTVVAEDAAPYVSRLAAELGEEIFTTHAAAIRHIATDVDWTPSARRSGGGGKIAAKWLAGYDELKEAGKLEQFCSVYGVDSSLPEEVLKPTVALRLKQVIEDAEDKARKEALSKLG